MNWGEKPVIFMGNGIRASGADPLPLLEFGVPVLSSWQAADLVDNRHPMYFGRPGIYGQRCANKIFFEADSILAIGARMMPWQIGHGGLRPEQKLTMVDVDHLEVSKLLQANHVMMDAKAFIELAARTFQPSFANNWLACCQSWKQKWPWIESPTHDSTNGYINGYRFIEKLEPLLAPDEVIVTDIGSFFCPVFQSLHVKPPQRLMTAGGMGEMGGGLPAAIGASFARNKGKVLCLIGDGGMMVNLQELQTIMHHKLPIKIVVFENDGYAMIKGTHRNLKIDYAGVNRASGVSMPDFCRVASAFKMSTCDVRQMESLDKWLPMMLKLAVPFLMQVHIDPEQIYAPRLQPIISPDGKITPPRFSELSPVL